MMSQIVSRLTQGVSAISGVFRALTGPAACTLALLVVSAAQAATLYWDGTGSTWGLAQGWSTVDSSDEPNPDAAPGASDVAAFSVTGVSGAQTVTLDANQAAKRLLVLSSASGGVTLFGAGTTRTLSLGTSGMEVLEGAGPLVIGSRASGQDIVVSLAGSQTWTNRSATSVVLQNGIGASGSYALTLTGTNGFRLNGPGTYGGGTTLSTTTVGLGDDAALGTGTFTLNTGTVLVEDFPRTMANKVKINSATTYWSGDGALTLTGSGTTPAFAISQYAGPSINIVNTAPMTISGLYSLCDTTVPNNNPQSPTLASGASLTIRAEILESNAGNSYNVNNKGAKFVFTGTGADLTLTGTNGFGEGASIGRSTEIIAQPGSGFNTITVGGPGGPGAVITPFGLSALFTNNGQGFYLKALENGQILGNSISLGQSVGNDGGRPLGFTGENDLTLGGSLTLGAGATLVNLASGTLTFTGTVNCVASRTLTILGPGKTVFASTSVLTGSSNLAGGLAKSGVGTLTLAGTSDLLGATTLRGGTTILDYTAGDASRLTAGTNTASALLLGGVDLQLKGGSHSQTLGAGGGTTIDAGHSRIRRTGDGTSTIALGAITRNSGGLIDVEDGVASTTTGNTSGILGIGYATVDGSDWATVSGGTITAYSGYTTLATPGTDQNVAHTGSASQGSASMRTIKLMTDGPGQSLTMTSGNFTLNAGGMLFLGADDYAVNGINLNYSGGLCVHHYGEGVLTLNLRLSGGFVQKAGPGTLVLACVTNNHSSSTYMLGGKVATHAEGCLGTGNLIFNGGTLQTTAGFTTTKPVSMGANGGTFQVDAGTLELAGRITGTHGALNKTGSGTLLFAVSNHFAGPVTVSEGSLKLGDRMALGPLNNAASASDRSISPVTVTGTGVLDIAGFAPAIGHVTLASGTITDSVGGGALGAYSFTLESGMVEAALTNVVMPYANNPGNRNNLYKRGTGEAVIASVCTYSGHTFVDGGTLRVNGALPDSAALVRAGGTLGGVGTLARTVNVEGGALAPGAAADQPGALTLGRHLRLDGGTLRIGVSGTGYGKVVLTNPDARVLLADAALAIELSPGGGTTLGAPLTIIDNQGANPIEGTFDGLPEGGAFTAGGRTFKITYLGGDGNDVALTSSARGTLVSVK